MSRPVLVTAKGLEGIDARDPEHVLMAEEPADYLSGLSRVLAGEHTDMGRRAMEYVRQHFNWDNNLPEVVLLLGASVAGR